MATQDINHIMNMVKNLSLDAKKQLRDELSTLVDAETVPQDDDNAVPNPNMVWTDEERTEILELLNSKSEGLTGAEIIEKHTANGNIGSWAHLGIKDGAEWVNEQKAKRVNKYTW